MFTIIRLTGTLFVLIASGVAWIMKKTGLWVLFALLGAWLMVLSVLESANVNIPPHTLLSDTLWVILIASFILGGVLVIGTTVRSIIRAIKRNPTWTYHKTKKQKEHEATLALGAEVLSKRLEEMGLYNANDQVR